MESVNTFNFNKIQLGDIVYIRDDSKEDEFDYYKVIQTPCGKYYDLMILDSTDEEVHCLPLHKKCTSPKHAIEIRYDYFNYGEYVIGVESYRNQDEIIEYALKHGYKPMRRLTLKEVEEQLGYRIEIIE